MKKIIVLICLSLPLNLFGLDPWIGWNLGNFSVGYNVIENDGYMNFELLQLIFFEEDSRLGIRWSLVETAPLFFKEEGIEELYISPIELIYSPMGKRKTWGAEMFMGAAMGTDEIDYFPVFQAGIRWSPFFSRSKPEHLYYIPNFSIQGFMDQNHRASIQANLDGLLIFMWANSNS